MAKLAIYMNEAGDSVVHHAGFSWFAALAPPVWALQQRLYKSAAVVLAFTTFSMLAVEPWIAQIPDTALRTAVQLGYILAFWSFFGFGAHIFHGFVLRRAGYFMTSAEPSRLKAES